MKRFQVYVVSKSGTFANIGGTVSAKSAAAAIAQQKKTYDAPRSMGRVIWRASEVK